MNFSNRETHLESRSTNKITWMIKLKLAFHLCVPMKKYALETVAFVLDNRKGL